MKRFISLIAIVLIINSSNIFCQRVIRASEALSVNRGYKGKALSNPLFKWTHYESKYFSFHYLPGAWSKERLDSVFTEMDDVYLRIAKLLHDTNGRNRIDIFLAGDKEDVKKICGGAFSAAALLPERVIVFSNHPATTAPENLPHEIMHVCSMDKWGLPFDFFLSEGLAAYACDKAAFNYDFYSITKYLKLNNRLPDIISLLNKFYSYNEITGYYSGAGFVKFVLDKYGLDKLKILWVNGVETGALKLGTTLKKIEAEWHSAFMKSNSISKNDWEKLVNM